MADADRPLSLLAGRDTVPATMKMLTPDLPGVSAEPAAALSPAALDAAIARATDALLAKQSPAGYWVAELQGDSILESEYILLKWILGQEADPDLPRVANYLRRLQADDGGWGLYPGSPPDLSGSAKAYFALKLMGDSPDAPHMAKARALIRRLGGAEGCNTFSRFYFACLGQVSFDSCPSIPPEIVFLPRWAYFNLYNVSAWTRTMILPLGIVTTLRPVRHGSRPGWESSRTVRRPGGGRRAGDARPRYAAEVAGHFISSRRPAALKTVRAGPDASASCGARAIAAAEKWLLTAARQRRAGGNLPADGLHR